MSGERGGQMRRPAALPAGWNELRLPTGDEGIWRETIGGLRALYSIDDAPPVERMRWLDGVAERWRHISFSREGRYPGWNEMRDFITTCGLFDPAHDVVMILPLDPARYVNLHPNCFHWWQPVLAGEG